MRYNRFFEIIANMHIGPGRPSAVLSEGPPQLTANYRAAGGGYDEHLFVQLDRSPIHVTIFRNSWDGTVEMRGNHGVVSVGPHALHLTDTERWFYVVESNGSLRSLSPDIGSPPTDRTRKAMDGVFMPVLKRYLFT